MNIPPILTKTRALITVAVVGAMAGIGAGLGFTLLQAHDEDTVPYVTPEECSGFGSSTFVGAESIDHLLSQAHVVAKVRVTERGTDSDVYAAGDSDSSMRYIHYALDVLDVLVGAEDRDSITLGVPFGEVCLDPGDDVYYMFMATDREPGEPYIDDPQRVQTPADYGLAWFGPQNVFSVDSGRVDSLEGWGSESLEPYYGISEQAFRDTVAESFARN